MPQSLNPRSQVAEGQFACLKGIVEVIKAAADIGKAQALLGSLLKVNPVIGIKDGEVHPYARERSRAKAIDHLYNFAASFGDVEGLAVEYATDLEEANRLVQRLHSKYPQVTIYLSRASPVIGTHTGPGLILVTVFVKRRADT